MTTHALHDGHVRRRLGLWRLLARVSRALPGKFSVDTPRPTLDELLTPSRWQRKVGNPELKKALGYVQGAIAEAQRVLAVPPDSLSLRTNKVKARLRDVLDQPVHSLTIDAAWELSGQVRALLPLLANGDYVAASSTTRRNERRTSPAGTAGTQHFGKDELVRMRSNYRRRQPFVQDVFDVTLVIYALIRLDRGDRRDALRLRAELHSWLEVRGLEARANVVGTIHERYEAGAVTELDGPRARDFTTAANAARRRHQPMRTPGPRKGSPYETSA
jgi:hypothetical protein